MVSNSASACSNCGGASVGSGIWLASCAGEKPSVDQEIRSPKRERKSLRGPLVFFRISFFEFRIFRRGGNERSNGAVGDARHDQIAGAQPFDVANESTVVRVSQAITARQHLQGAERFQPRGNFREFLCRLNEPVARGAREAGCGVVQTLFEVANALERAAKSRAHRQLIQVSTRERQPAL